MPGPSAADVINEARDLWTNFSHAETYQQSSGQQTAAINTFIKTSCSYLFSSSRPCGDPTSAGNNLPDWTDVTRGLELDS